jgi:hypothetical protein
MKIGFVADHRSNATVTLIAFSVFNTVRMMTSESGQSDEVRKGAIMRPPECCMCDKTLGDGYECEMLVFKQVPADVIASVRGIQRVGYEIPDHPDHMEWFCSEHSILAKQFLHLTIHETVAQLKSLIESYAGDRSLYRSLVLDDLFTSECPLCSNWAGWTGVIEEEYEYQRSPERETQIGPLMHCPNCEHRFQDLDGALQEFLRQNPPLFIPGRRLSDKVDGQFETGWPNIDCDVII